MMLPKAPTEYAVEAECPDCGYTHITAWEARPVDGETDLLTRRCHCPECGCWFQEDLRLALQSVEIETMREDGETERRTESERNDLCPSCGKPLEEDDDPYFGETDAGATDYEEEVDYRRTKDAKDGLLRRVYYCLDCRLEQRETYRMERAGVQVIRHGMGPKDSESCPECGSPDATFSVTQVAPSGFSVLCECHGCGCVYRLETEETHNHTRVTADRDGWYADGNHKSLFLDPVAGEGDECPMCESGTLVADRHDGESPYRGRRSSRFVDYECPTCFTMLTDVFATRVVHKTVIEEGDGQMR